MIGPAAGRQDFYPRFVPIPLQENSDSVQKFSAYFAGKFLHAIAWIEASDRDMAEEIRDLLSGEG